jgi:flagellar assembly protein FliH
MATVIKAAQQDPRVIRRLETVNVADHLAEARIVLERSRDEARRMLREAQAEAARITERASSEGYDAGFRRGHEAGQRAGQEEAFAAAKGAFEADQTQTLAALRAVMDEYEGRKRDLFIAARQDVVRFAARLAEKVTRQVGAVRPESAVANLDAAMRIVESATDMVVHVSPADRDVIAKFAESLDSTIREARNITIVADDTVAPGGCRVSTTAVEVDATLDTQIARIVELMVPQPGETA